MTIQDEFCWRTGRLGASLRYPNGIAVNPGTLTSVARGLAVSARFPACRTLCVKHPNCAAEGSDATRPLSVTIPPTLSPPIPLEGLYFDSVLACVRVNSAGFGVVNVRFDHGFWQA